MDENNNDNPSILSELGKRRVVRTLAVYVALAWASVEIFLTVFDRLGAPEWIGTTLIIVFIAGFPLVTLASWMFDIENGRVKRVATGRVSVLASVLAVATLASTVAAVSVFTDTGQRGETTAASFEAFNNLTTRPLTTDEGFEFFPAISPDGGLVAYSRPDPAGGADVYFRTAETGVAQQVTRLGTYDAWPAWSGDGSRFAFLSLSETQKIVVHSIVDGQSVELVDLTSHGLQTLAELDWSSDGQWFAFTAGRDDDDSKGEQEQALFLVSATTGELVELGPSKAGWSRIQPRFSPDGQQIAFISASYAEGFKLCIMPMSSREERCLTPRGQSWEFASFDWLPDGKKLIGTLGFAIGSRQIAQVDVETAEMQPVSFGTNADYIDVALTRNRIVIEDHFRDHNIWRFPGPEGDPAEPPKRIIGSTRDDTDPWFSPDGSQIAFQSTRSGNWEIWAADADGSNQRQLSRMGFANFPSWAPDGQRVTFASYKTPGVAEAGAIQLGVGVGRAFTVSAQGGIPTPVFGGDEADVILARWSQLGDYLYVNGPKRNPCGFALWRTDLNGSEELIGDCLMRVEYGGNDRYFAFNADMDVVSFDPQGNELKLELPLSTGGICEQEHPTGWTSWNNEVVYLDCRDVTIRITDDTLEEGRVIAQVENYELINEQPQLDVSPDGQWVLLDRLDRTGSDLFLVDWESLEN